MLPSFFQISSLLSWTNVYLFTKWPRFIWGSAEDNFKTIEERFYWRSIIIVKYYQFPPSLFASFSSIMFAFLKIEINQMKIGWLLSHLFIKVYKSSASTFVMWTIWFMNWTDQVYAIRSKLNPTIIEQSARTARPLN